MAKRTAIIDIGSNSARLVIFERTSRYGFHLICEKKSKVRIGEGAYEKEGYLQPIGIERAFLALQSFLQTIQHYQVKKVRCVATSALRDAPNASLFIAWVKEHLGLEIRVISGEMEARYGAIAVKNLLPIQSAITIDIGGGSSDLTQIQNGEIVACYSLDIGTVRLKELFFDKELPMEQKHQEANAYIQKALQQLPSSFKGTLAVGIGGTARTLSKAIMKRSKHPLDKLHAFEYEVAPLLEYFQAITQSSAKGLKAFQLKKSRYDTIREGTLIFQAILAHIGAKRCITSSVGVREGVFLEQLLKHNHLSFPPEINPSVTSILDRFSHFIPKASQHNHALQLSKSLCAHFEAFITLTKQEKEALFVALKLSSIGKHLTLYKSHQHAFYIAMQELNYQFSHQEMILIAMLLRIDKKELLNQPLFKTFEPLLPSRERLLWLYFFYALSTTLTKVSYGGDISFHFEKSQLIITSNTSLYLAKESIKAIHKPIPFAIMIRDCEKIPKHSDLGV